MWLYPTPPCPLPLIAAVLDNHVPAAANTSPSVNAAGPPGDTSDIWSRRARPPLRRSGPVSSEATRRAVAATNAHQPVMRLPVSPIEGGFASPSPPRMRSRRTRARNVPTAGRRALLRSRPSCFDRSDGGRAGARVHSGRKYLNRQLRSHHRVSHGPRQGHAIPTISSMQLGITSRLRNALPPFGIQASSISNNACLSSP